MNLYIGWNRRMAWIVSWVWDALDPDSCHEREYYNLFGPLSPTMLYWYEVKTDYNNYHYNLIATGPWF